MVLAGNCGSPVFTEKYTEYSKVADGSAGLQVIDVTTPATPALLGFVNTPGSARGVDVDPGRMLAVVAEGSVGVQVVDISNPLTPTLLGSIPTGNAQDLVVSGSAAVVADFANSMTLVDLTNPLIPAVLAATPGKPADFLTTWR